MSKLAGRDIEIVDYEQAFLAHRAEIERIASRKYDAASVLYLPFEITPSDVGQFFPRSERDRPRRTDPAGSA